MNGLRLSGSRGQPIRKTVFSVAGLGLMLLLAAGALDTCVRSAATSRQAAAIASPAALQCERFMATTPSTVVGTVLVHEEAARTSTAAGRHLTFAARRLAASELHFECAPHGRAPNRAIVPGHALTDCSTGSSFDA